MNSSPAAIVGILDSLSIGMSRTSIRLAHTQPRTRHKRKKYHLTGFKPRHGEQIFVFNHIESGMIIHSHEPKLKRDSQKFLSQIPYTVKKQKPPVIRKDYWEPLCMIQFQPGQGVVGRSVFQKLREFRQLHELEWGWQAKELQKLNRRDRGAKIHNQKPNAIADIAAVLGGAGRGNMMWTTEPLAVEESPALEAAREAEAEVEKAEAVGAEEAADAPAQASAADQPAAETEAKALPSEVTLEATPAAEALESKNLTVASKTKKSSDPAQPPRRLLPITIHWANDVDLNWARKWSENVTHKIGLPDDVWVWRWNTKEIMSQEDETPVEEVTAEEAVETVEGAEASAEAKESEANESQEPTEEAKSESKQKKGWLGWLGGKSSGSGQDARP